MFSYTHTKSFPNSTSIDTVYYDQPTKILVVQFVNGNEAAYRDVPVHVYTDFQTAYSAGQYYNAFVKGQYIGTGAPFGPYKTREDIKASQTPNAKTDSTGAAAASAGTKFHVSGIVTFDVSDILVLADSVAEAVEKFETALRDATFANGSVNSVSLDVSGVNKA